MTIEDFLESLESVTISGNDWSARCPAHDDTNPSLSVAEGDDGRILVHCFAGCTAEDVTAALGLTLADLMPERPGTSEFPPARQTRRRNRPRVHARGILRGEASPVEFLKGLGVADDLYRGSTAIHSPLHGGQEDCFRPLPHLALRKRPVPFEDGGQPRPLRPRPL